MEPQDAAEHIANGKGGRLPSRRRPRVEPVEPQLGGLPSDSSAMPAERVSQKRIAELLDLSTATVSRSLRNDKSIHPSTRARVIAAASKLGYRLPQRTPSQDSRISSDRPVSFEVLVANSAWAGRAGEQMLAGISRAASTHEVSISVHVVPPGGERDLLVTANQSVGMRSGLVDGLILMHPLPDPVIAELSMRIPCVSVLHRFQGHAVDGVGTHQEQAVSQLVQYLYRLGHRRIGFGGWGRWMWEQHRLAGYRDGLFVCNLPYDEGLIYDLNGDLRNAAKLADTVEEKMASGVTAWVCVADPVAYELAAELESRGIRIGKDVSLTGYDGVEPPAGSRSLTTVRVPFAAVGDAAVRRLLHRLEEPASPLRDILVRFETVFGASTGPAPV